MRGWIPAPGGITPEGGLTGLTRLLLKKIQVRAPTAPRTTRVVREIIGFPETNPIISDQ